LAEELDKAKSKTLTEDAAAWLIALDGGTADRAAFEAWRGDARHAVAFAKVAAHWNELDRLRPMRGSPSVKRAQLMSRRTLLRGAVAAGVVATIGGIGWPLIDEVSAETGIGERRTIRLPDGSMLELNTRTRVRWRRFGAVRALWLDDGEVNLSVARGGDFVVNATTPVVLTSGEYNLRRSATSFETVTLTGTARAMGLAATSARRLFLSAGRTSLRLISPTERDRAQSWRRGEIVFMGEPLGFVLDEYNRYLDRPLVLGDPQLADLRLGGRFASTNPKTFLAALRAGFDLSVQDAGTGAIVIGARKK